MSERFTGKNDGLIKHGTILLVATIITGLSNTLFNIAMLKMLTKENFGDYTGLVSLYMILAFPLTAVQMVTARYVSALESKRLLGQAASLLRRSLLKLSLTAAAVLIAFLAFGQFLAGYLNVHSLGAVYVVGLSVAFALISSVFWGALQGFQYFYHYAANQIVSTVAKLGGGILLVWLGLEVVGAVGSLVFFYLTAVIMAVFPLYVVLFKLAGGDEEADSLPHYRFFWPVFVSLLAFAVFTYADFITVKHFFPRYNAGEYGLAQVVGKAFLFIPVAISTALFPKVTRRTAALESSSLEILNLSLVYCIVLCVIGIVVCVFFAELILLLPEGTMTAVKLVRIFGIGVTPVALLYIMINYLLARGRAAFLYFLIPMALAYVAALQVWHATLATVIWVMAGFGLVAGTGLYLVIFFSERSAQRERLLYITKPRF
ncbi:MAG TPA: oligosaccharide flippase family protein [archaeon]|nr:oligosaccharide flippase family protein [archaeon]